ncbi:MAG: alpha/beta fold hydrolase [Pseudomonadota bacterium]
MSVGMSETLKVTAADGHAFDLTIFSASANAPLLLIGPAMGTPARIYAPLAEAFAKTGVNAAVIELRGIGSSSLRAGKKVNYGYRDLVEKDWAAALSALRTRFAGSPTYLFGHSLGGQVSVLHAAAHPANTAGVVIVACGSVYYRSWKGMKALGILSFTQFAGVLSGALGYFPGKRVGFGGTEAKTLMQDWARFGRTGRLDLAGDGVDYETAMSKLEKPVLGLSFDHDDLAPHRSQQNLLDKLTKARVSHLALGEKDTGARLNHYNWIKQNNAVVRRVVQWINNNGVAS